MNKQEFIEAIANEVEVTKATAAGCLDAFINTVTKVLKKKAKFAWLALVHLQLLNVKQQQVVTHKQVHQLKLLPLHNLSSVLVKL